jgi:hypothetical protein
MWKDLFSFIQNVLTLAKEQDRLRDEVKRLERLVLEQSLLLQRISDKLDMNAQKDRDEREKLALQLQIEMLKFEKRLPPAEKKKDEE